MEIRQVLKSSASMIPDLFYKVSDETREMEKNRDSGGKRMEGEKDEPKGGVEKGKTVHGGGQWQVWKNPQIWRGGVSRKVRKRGMREDRRRTKEKPVKCLAVGARLA